MLKVFFVIVRCFINQLDNVVPIVCHDVVYVRQAISAGFETTPLETSTLLSESSDRMSGKFGGLRNIFAGVNRTFYVLFLAHRNFVTHSVFVMSECVIMV